METFILALEITDVSLFCIVVKTHKNMQSINTSKKNTVKTTADWGEVFSDPQYEFPWGSESVSLGTVL